MRNTANFHPEWGYLAPTPIFIRTMRVVVVATAVGATVGAGVGFSWVSHPTTETSVAARTLVRPIEAVSARANTPAQAAQASTPPPSEKQWLAVIGPSADGAPSERSASSTTRAREGIAALAEAPAATDGPATAAIAAPPTPVKERVVHVTPIKKKATTKPGVTWRYASRDEPVGLVPGEYSTRKSSGGYRTSGARGGYYRESRHWGGYYGDDRGRPYQDW